MKDPSAVDTDNAGTVGQGTLDDVAAIEEATRVTVEAVETSARDMAAAIEKAQGAMQAAMQQIDPEAATPGAERDAVGGALKVTREAVLEAASFGRVSAEAAHQATRDAISKISQTVASTAWPTTSNSGGAPPPATPTPSPTAPIPDSEPVTPTIVYPWER